MKHNKGNSKMWITTQPCRLQTNNIFDALILYNIINDNTLLMWYIDPSKCFSGSLSLNSCIHLLGH